jgi:hypothetical protein
MLPKEVTRSIHEIISFLHLAPSREFRSKAIEYTPSDERTGYIDDTLNSHIDDTPERVRSMILRDVVGHLYAQYNSVF